MYHRRQLRLSLYVKAIICVGCALSRGRKERRTNTNNGKNSNPELSKKGEIEGGNGQDTMSSRNMNERHIREIHVGFLPPLLAFASA